MYGTFGTAGRRLVGGSGKRWGPQQRNVSKKHAWVPGILPPGGGVAALFRWTMGLPPLGGAAGSSPMVWAGEVCNRQGSQ